MTQSAIWAGQEVVSAASIAEEGEESSFSVFKLIFFSCIRSGYAHPWKDYIVLLYCYSSISYAFHIENARLAQATLKSVLKVNNDNFSLKACREILERLGFEGLSHVYS